MIRSYSTLFVSIVLFLSVCFAQSNTAVAESSPAEKLVTALPDDVVAFVATSGADELQPAFEKTILGRIWNDQGVQTFYQSIKKELLAKVVQEMPELNDAGVDLAEGIIRQVTARPFVVGAARKDNAQGPPIYGFAILDAGPRKAEMAASLATLESFADEGDIVEIEIGSAKMHGPKDPGDVPGYWGWVGNYFVFAINDGEGLATKYLQGQRSRPAPGYLLNVPGAGDALAVYVDREKVFSILSTVSSMEGGEDEFRLLETVIRELGLDKIKTLTARAGFAGPDVVVDGLLEIPQPPTGMLANLKTVDLGMFDMVDARAMGATAVNCDLTGIYDTVMKAIQNVAGDEYAEIEEGIAAVEAEMQLKIRKGLLESLAGPMVFYALPSGVMTQSPQGGVVMIATLKDAELWQETLAALGEFAAEESEGMVQVSSQVQNGRTMHTWAIAPLAMMQVMPSWTVLGDRVIVASNPTVCSLAVDQITSGTKSIRSTDGFKNVTRELPDNLVYFGYKDSKVQFNQVMTGLQQFWPMVTMAAADADLELPFVLPSLSHIAEDMGSSCGYMWFDSEGFRSHYQGPGVEH